MKTLIYIICWPIRLFMWVASGFGLFARQIIIRNKNTDELHPFAFYSLGGLPRKKFMILYVYMKTNEKNDKSINLSQLYHQKYGYIFLEKVPPETIEAINIKSNKIRNYFENPWI